MTNIAHLVFSFGTGGIEKGVVTIVNNTDTSLYHHVIICLTCSGPSVSLLLHDNFEIVELNKKKGNDFSLPYRLFRIFYERKIDVVHLRGWPTLVDGIIAARLARVKKVIYGFHGKTHGELKKRSLKRRIAEIAAVRCVDEVITLSELMAMDFAKDTLLNPKHIKIIHNGVDTQKFSPERSGSMARKILGIDEGDFVVGTVGRLDPVKDFETLITSFSMLMQTVPTAQLVIIGDGEEAQRLKLASTRSGFEDRIRMLGARSDVDVLLPGFDVYVQSSLYEGFSNTIVEAMATGLPIIATRVGGNPLLVRDGVNGEMFTPGDVEDLKKLLIMLFNNQVKREAYCTSSRYLVTANYSQEVMVEKYAESYCLQTD